MPPDAPFTPPKKKPSALWWVGGGFVFLMMLFVLQLFGPNRPIVVSRQTTYITAPLGADGLPDYERYIRETSREGVTLENNAAVLLWQALWPGELDPKDYAAVAAELGLRTIPSASDALSRLHSRANQEAMYRLLEDRSIIPRLTDGDGADIGMPAGGSEIVETVLDRTMSQPWTSEEFPPLAKWVTVNKKPFEMLVDASRRPRCYFPSPSHLNRTKESLIEMLLPGAQSVRESGRALSARAMWHLGEGRVEDAWSDLMAAQRIGRLTAQGPTIVEQLVGMAIAGMANDATLALLGHRKLTVDQARQIHRDLCALPAFASMADAIDRTDRVSILDAIIHVTRGTGKVFFDGQFEDAPTALGVVSLDWNIALRRANEYCDRIAAVARIPDRPARNQAFLKFNRDLHQFEYQIRQPASLAAGAMSRASRSEIVAGLMLAMFLPATEAAMNAEDRAIAMLELTRLAAALAVFRAEHGAYPAKLDDLVPGVVDKLPVDLYNGKSFVYKRTKDGYLLYSVGENGVDDGGSNENMNVLEGRAVGEEMNEEWEKLHKKIPQDADDYSIRLPRPKWEMPKLPAASEQ